VYFFTPSIVQFFYKESNRKHPNFDKNFKNYQLFYLSCVRLFIFSIVTIDKNALKQWLLEKNFSKKVMRRVREKGVFGRIPAKNQKNFVK